MLMIRRIVQAPPSEPGFEFPPEIEEYLVGFLSNDPYSLKACALVCRAWLAASRTHLFRNVTIENAQMYRRFEEMVVNSPMVRKYARTVCIHRQIRDRELTLPWLDDNLSPRLLSQLTRLETFELKFEGQKLNMVSFRNPAFTSVTDLSISRCTISTEVLFTLICAFPSLKNLRIGWCLAWSSGRDDPLYLMHKPKLERLFLHLDDIPSRNCGRETLLSLLIDRGCLEFLRQLEIAVSRGNAVEVGKFIHHIGHQLEDLRIQYVNRFGYDDTDLTILLDNISLAENLNMKRLVFGNPVHPATRTLLSCAIPSHVRTIWFTFRLDYMEGITPSEPELLEQALNTPSMSHIKEVRFVLVVDSGRIESVEKVYQKAYPSLYERGILRVDCMSR